MGWPPSRIRPHRGTNTLPQVGADWVLLPLHSGEQLDFSPLLVASDGKGVEKVRKLDFDAHIS